MYSLLKETQSYFTIQTNSWIFQLHSKITVGILVISFILVSTYDYIDSSAIQCLGDKKIGISPRTLNTYCWFSSTYTVPRHWTGTQGKTNLNWGVGISSEEDDRVHHAYYQWVPYFLIFLTLLFSLPYFLWKTSYGDHITNLTNGVEMEKRTKLDKIAQYILTRKEGTFLIGLISCEALNLMIVGLVIFLINKFLGGNFYSYGAEVINWQATDPEERADPISRIFPKMTKCDFYRFGPSGTIITYDALCLLGINILNEKIFLFLWFWLLLVGILGSLLLFLRILTAVSSLARRSIGRFYFSGRTCCQVVSQLSAEQWILTQQLSLELEKQSFDELLTELSALLLNSRNTREKLLLEQP